MGQSVGKLTVVRYEDVNPVDCVPVVVGTYTAYGCVKTVTPPGQTRELVDNSCLEDDFGSHEPGGENPTTMVLNIAFDVGSGVDDKLQEQYDAQCAFNVQITNPKWAKQYQFPAKIASLEPQEISRTDIMVMQVTFARTGALTRPANP